MLSATLAALHEAGWPLRPLADALGISKQAVRPGCAGPARGVAHQVLNCDPSSSFPHRRVASAAASPHLTIKIDHALRVCGHRAAADEGDSLTR